MKKFIAVGAVLFFACSTAAQTADQKKETLAYLRKLQNDDGGFRPTAKAAPSSLRATSSALRATRYFGGDVAGKKACLVFVKSCFDKKAGGFSDAPKGKPDVVVTSVGLMALVELKAPVGDYQAPAIAFLVENAQRFEEVRMAAAGLEAIRQRSSKNEAWLRDLGKGQNPDGTFGKGDGLARDTGGVVAAVLRLGGKLAKPEGVVKALDAKQGKDGGYAKASAKGSDLETTYRVMRTYHMLKAKPARAADLGAFVARCRNADGGYGAQPGQPSSVGGTYFAGIILSWLTPRKEEG